ncbi:MAG: A/G-specific adenine glycosylase [Gammaproteobacteria bacterium]|jgi:A/G-specific adenine glycosylase|nr:A/G-specific adenine glycosylase [Gammaproteobacteria bacterium]MBT4462504.1 A/G-specific adenine glycosylase [Gammaproteobacteria bacterium]MBT4654751.1 A/G-specific adenine glycosylase [Gammaproteobacteria bacterium]MBT5116532.1 A/G-specific adenine glycosylase [Gammaproteobacteria bacterium]MBT5761624.1 A/G-specific adenine glycosylase [Gammaproteobacteria bacterium]
MNLKKELTFHSKNRLIIRKKVLDWYDVNGRKNLPWKTSDIYKIWISEIMLQQTQVRTVLPYYAKFIKEYPTLNDLLNASLDNILELWSGLGFYRRAENIYKACLVIKKDHNSRFPKDYDAINALPGIGRTTASAIVTFSGNGTRSILDGNVKRFLSRLFSLEQSTNINYLWTISEYLLPNSRSADFIQSYMDIGSLICKKSNPDCSSCPVNSYCKSFKSGIINNIRSRKTSKTSKDIWVVALTNTKNQFYLKKVIYGNLWKGLYSSPIFKNNSEPEEWIARHNLNSNGILPIYKFSHHLTHIKFTFNIIFCKVKLNKKISLSDDNWYNLSDIDVGIPKYQDKIFNQYKSIYDYN